MRILRVADVPDNRTGGMSRLMHFTSEELVAAGHQVQFVFQDQLGESVTTGLRRFVVPLRIVSVVRQLARIGQRFDAVEIHEPSAAAYAAARLIDRSLPPLVVISHGLERRALQTMLAYWRSKGIPASLKQKYSYRLTGLWQSDFALKHAAHVIVLNSEDREYLASHLGVPPDRVTVIHSAVGPCFLECPTGPSPGFGVLFLASWLERKGIREAVPVITAVLKQCPSAAVTIAGCGKPAAEVLADFPTQCRAAIRVVPAIHGEAALLAEYRKHSVYLLPSVFEGQPLTMMEAAAAGLALVCTDTCGMKDFIRHGENGLLAAVGDAAGLKEAVLGLLRDPSLAARLGRQAQRDSRHCTWKHSSQLFAAGVQRGIDFSLHSTNRHEQ